MLHLCFTALLLAYRLPVPVLAPHPAIGLRPRLVVEEKSGAARVLALVFKRDSPSFVKTPDGSLELRLEPAHNVGAGESAFTVEVTFRKPTWVRLVALELPLGGNRAQVMGRDLRPTEVAGTAWLERFDPKWIVVNRGAQPIRTVLIDDTVDDVRVRRTPTGVVARIDLDSVAARPFTHDRKCTHDWHDPNAQVHIDARLRQPGERITARVQILPGAPTPLAKAHFPDGRRAAFVITDHADQTSARTLAVLADALIAHHLVITKALFASDKARPQLDDSHVLAIADQLARAGSEIVPHSATPHPDTRAVTEKALELFSHFGARTWIDHQPETNCEAFGDEGYRVHGPFAIADLLAAHGYRYVWAEEDAPPGALNLLDAGRLDRRAPTLYPLGRLAPGGPADLWMFRTQWAFVDAPGFYAMFSPAQLNRLERERGIAIEHTYLETYHPRGTRFGRRNLFVPAHGGAPGGPGPVALEPGFDALLGDLEAREQRGTLWVPTLGELGDRLRAVAALTMTPTPGRVVLQSAQPLAGATFVIPRRVRNLRLGGRRPTGIRVEGGSTVFWADLPAGTTPVTFSVR